MLDRASNKQIRRFLLLALLMCGALVLSWRLYFDPVTLPPNLELSSPNISASSLSVSPVEPEEAARANREEVLVEMKAADEVVGLSGSIRFLD